MTVFGDGILRRGVRDGAIFRPKRPTEIETFVYAVWDNNLTKFDSDGNHIWTTSVWESITTDVSADEEGNAYVSSNDRTVRKLDPAGNLLWTHTASGTSPINCVTLDRQGNVYAGSNSSGERVRKLTPNGELVWLAHTVNSCEAIAIDLEGNVYTGGVDRRITKFPPGGGSLIWDFRDPTQNINALAIFEDHVYAATGDFVWRASLINGLGDLWITNTGRGAGDMVFDAEGAIYVGCQEQVEKYLGQDLVWIWADHEVGFGSAGIRGMALARDGSLYTASGDRTLRKSIDGVQIWATDPSFTGNNGFRGCAVTPPNRI